MSEAPIFTVEPTVAANPDGDTPLVAIVSFETDRPVTASYDISDGVREWTVAPKMAPVSGALRADSHFEPVVIATAQHRQMLDQVFAWFGITPDHDLDRHDREHFLLLEQFDLLQHPHQGLSLERFETMQPTLEDVFLELTGRSMDAADKEVAS